MALLLVFVQRTRAEPFPANPSPVARSPVERDGGAGNPARTPGGIGAPVAALLIGWHSPAMANPDMTGVWALIGEDFRTHRRNPLSAGLHALVVHRLGIAIYSSANPLVRFARPVYKLANAFVEAVYGIELPLQTKIGRRLHLPHPQGVVLVVHSVLGDDCMIRHNVTVGAGSDTEGGYPTIGNRVQFGPGSIVMGAVTVGDDVLIGPGAVVVEDVAAGSRVLAPTAVSRPPKSPRRR